MRHAFPRLALLAGCLLLASPATANDGGADPRTTTTPSATVDPVYRRAMVEVKAGRYAAAIPLLVDVVGNDSRNADAFNNLGYSHRKLGQRDKALIYYAEALRLDPKHLGALEYQGELFLELGDLARAETNLDQLGRLCGRCENYRDLAEAIVAHKAKPRT